jgi:hypothetical protein
MSRYRLVLAMAAALGSGIAAADGSTGKLVFDLKPFVEGVELRKHTEKKRLYQPRRVAFRDQRG